MKISILKLVPKDWLIEDKRENIQISYQNFKGNNPKLFTFPKEIRIDEKFMEGVGLYLGDGDLNRKDKSHLGYCSKDKDIAKHALNFLQNYFNVNIKDITFTVQYKKENNKLKEEWASYLSIPKEKILTRFSNRHKNECIQIQVNGVIFRKIFEIVIKKILNKNFISNKKLRRGILRGLFAAEGNVGVDYLEKKPYISQMTFDLHINENQIEEIITNILDKESISYRINNRENRNSKEIIISNWINYKKFWEMDLFNLCQRKKDKFLNIMHNLKIYCILEDKYLSELFKKQNLKQKEIAKLINSWQGNVSKTIKGKHLLTLENFNLLCNRVNEKNHLDKIKNIRIGSLTILENNKENKNFINYLYNIKTNLV